MTIDPNTGMPEVPEGYFWRVKKSLLTGDTFTDVELRVKWFFMSYVVASHPIYNSHVSAQSILEAAEYIMLYSAWSERRRGETKEHLYGDYPPNKLGNN